MRREDAVHLRGLLNEAQVVFGRDDGAESLARQGIGVHDRHADTVELETGLGRAHQLRMPPARRSSVTTMRGHDR